MSTFPVKCDNEPLRTPNQNLFPVQTGVPSASSFTSTTFQQAIDFIAHNEISLTQIAATLHETVYRDIQDNEAELQAIRYRISKHVKAMRAHNTKDIARVEDALRESVLHAIADIAISLTAVEYDIDQVFLSTARGGLSVPAMGIMEQEVPIQPHLVRQPVGPESGEGECQPVPHGGHGIATEVHTSAGRPTATVITIPGQNGTPTIQITINITVLPAPVQFIRERDFASIRPQGGDRFAEGVSQGGTAESGFNPEIFGDTADEEDDVITEAVKPKKYDDVDDPEIFVEEEDF